MDLNTALVRLYGLDLERLINCVDLKLVITSPNAEVSTLSVFHEVLSLEE